ncbi:50S ribosomal protein L13 [Thermosulfuriphilus ammonigenes]|uniref:Large ribosomal subunit protein uL13 n=1 Tax=Thermosulfuriphilus ammonigenes TaxID=1936021 RepID=A0A6G7PU59_9BACT|nr:50S ribosomal protein L13 [Thermosulfuriphilus ammonigenes]MBA2848775.1 large subunit ribosomal protein L13 [Thermosulfuriphilus ammonigenes]QIJ71096.1 50S ribosomal protein L13 [Thermosulfuriphilus ammonigenes]HFB83812.1 50S ribosomal protein L13 [Thermodesulfatator sp.]
MKTPLPKVNEIKRKWYVVDAKDKVLGRLATQIAIRLRGKHKPEFTPHLDTGDFIIVINADKVRLTGKKLTDKFYYRHSGYMGGLKVRSAAQMLAEKPEEVIRLAVKRMLPRNRLSRKLLKKLKVYRGEEHPHQAQQPEKLDL